MKTESPILVIVNEKLAEDVSEFHFYGDSVGIRTQDPQLRRLLLYPAELRNRANSSAKIHIFFVFPTFVQ